MVTTCGIFLLNKNDQILIGHPTNHSKNFWSIPKGLKEKNETPAIAAFREFEEETGINLLSLPWSGFRCLGNFIYENKKKMLIAYLIKVDYNIDVNFMQCKSMVSKKVYGVSVPEIDAFMWINRNEAENLLHQSQVEALKKI